MEIDTVKRTLCVGLLALFLGACAGTRTSERAPVIDGGTQAEVQVEMPKPPAATAYPYERGEPDPVIESRPDSASPAVTSLLSRAETASGERDWPSAAAALERALRIEPRNPVLWNRLAEVRLQQGLNNQAIQLASKSNSLAGQDRLLQARNWRLIARARRNQGDEQGAVEAERRAEALR